MHGLGKSMPPQTTIQRVVPENSQKTTDQCWECVGLKINNKIN